MNIRKRARTLAGAAALATAATVFVGVPAAHADGPDSCQMRDYYNPAIGMTKSIPHVTLRRGSSGTLCVGMVQFAIDNLYGRAFGDPAGRYPLATDNIYGAQTEAWVRRFQSDYRWCAGDVDGVAGPNTLSCLAHLSAF